MALRMTSASAGRQPLAAQYAGPKVTHAQRVPRGLSSRVVLCAGNSLSMPSENKSTMEDTITTAGQPAHLSRRSALAGAVMMLPAITEMVMHPKIANAEEEEDEREYDENGVMIGLGTAKLKLQAIPLDDGAYYEVPGVWKSVPGSGAQWSDPLLGPQVQQVTKFSAETDLKDIADLGKIERVSLTKLPVPEELIRADLIGLRKTTRNGRVFYEWDLALAPATCPREQQLVQGLCFPDTVVLVSATVASGKIMVLEVRSNQSQWERASKNIKEVRESFGVAA